MLKTCFKCGEAKPVDNFYRHKGMADGFLGKCKTCTKRDTREHRKANPEKYAAYELSRAKDPARAAARTAYAKTPAGLSSGARAKRRYIDRNPEKRKATVAVGNAVRDGRLKRRPCEECGSVNAQAHHDDYTKPLDVRWLCPKHHKEWHAKNTPIS